MDLFTPIAPENGMAPKLRSAMTVPQNMFERHWLDPCALIVLPADDKQNTRLLVSIFIVETLQSLKISLPARGCRT